MNYQPHDLTDQQQADSPQGEDHLKFGHDNVLPLNTRGGEAAGVQRGPAAFSNSVTQKPCLGRSLPTLAADSVVARAESAAFSSLSASAGSGTAGAATSAGAMPPMAAAALSVPLSAFLDAGLLCPCGIDFDDDREFDFSKVKARPQLRLVISNSKQINAT